MGVRYCHRRWRTVLCHTVSITTVQASAATSPACWTAGADAASLERVAETGRLRFIDVSEAQEREVSYSGLQAKEGRYPAVSSWSPSQLGYQTQLQTLNEYNGRLLSPNNPISRRVHKVASRIVEGSGLGHVKNGGALGSVESRMPTISGTGSEMNMGEVLFGGGQGEMDVREGKDTEWEVRQGPVPARECPILCNAEHRCDRSMSSTTRRRKTRLCCLEARSLSLPASWA